MDRAKLEAERDKLEKELRVMMDITDASKKKGLVNFMKGFKASGKAPTAEEKAEIKRKLLRLREVGQMLADMPDKEERFP